MAAVSLLLLHISRGSFEKQEAKKTNCEPAWVKLSPARRQAAALTTVS